MTKITNKEKVVLYQKYKDGDSIKNLSKQFGLNGSFLRYIIQMVEGHGTTILRKNNQVYNEAFSQEIISKVLTKNQPIRQTALQYELSSHALVCNWIKKHKEMGYAIIERKRGRPKIMKKNKQVDLKDKNALLKQKEEEILYLKVENEYFKKLHAAIQSKRKRQSSLK